VEAVSKFLGTWLIFMVGMTNGMLALKMPIWAVALLALASGILNVVIRELEKESS
jgi:hypothetical protein